MFGHEHRKALKFAQTCGIVSSAIAQMRREHDIQPVIGWTSSRCLEIRSLAEACAAKGR